MSNNHVATLCLTFIAGMLFIAIYLASANNDIYVVHHAHHTCIVDHTGFSDSISCDWGKK